MEELPLEVVHHLFEWMSMLDVFRLAATSSFWKKLVDNLINEKSKRVEVLGSCWVEKYQDWTRQWNINTTGWYRERESIGNSTYFFSQAQNDDWETPINKKVEFHIENNNKKMIDYLDGRKVFIDQTFGLQVEFKNGIIETIEKKDKVNMKNIKVYFFRGFVNYVEATQGREKNKSFFHKVIMNLMKKHFGSEFTLYFVVGNKCIHPSPFFLIRFSPTKENILG
jgi:hypothetical protein